MNKKLYIQPSFREVITQLDSYMDIIQASTEEEQFPIGEGDGEGDAKFRDEWSENGLW